MKTIDDPGTTKLSKKVVLISAFFVILVFLVIILGRSNSADRERRPPGDGVSEEDFELVKSSVSVEPLLILNPKGHGLKVGLVKQKLGEDDIIEGTRYETDQGLFELIDHQDGQSMLDNYAYWRDALGDPIEGTDPDPYRIVDLGLLDSTIYPFRCGRVIGFIITGKTGAVWARVWSENGGRSAKIIQVGNGSMEGITAFVRYISEIPKKDEESF